jgi:3,4-dihydroxy 2-butanone 4-phosphate synthase/GTP cyclohydrolase II
MEAAQALIQQAGSGIVIWLDQEGKGNGHLALVESIQYKKAGFSQADAYVKAGYVADARDYRAAAEILSDLNVKSIVLLANGTDKAADLQKESIAVTETRPLTP